MGCASSREVDPWCLASQGNSSQLGQWLIRGGNVNAVDKLKGRGSLLHAAAAANHVDCIQLLLKEGANVDISTPEHGTPLHAAAASGASNAVTQLLASGASTNARLDGKTAAETAQQKGFQAIARCIQSSNATPAAADAGHSGDNRSTEATTSQRHAPAQQHAQQQHGQQHGHKQYGHRGPTGHSSRSSGPAVPPAQQLLDKAAAQQAQRERDRSAILLAKEQMRKADAAGAVADAGPSRQQAGGPRGAAAAAVGPARAAATAGGPPPQLVRPVGLPTPHSMQEHVLAVRPVGVLGELQQQADSLERERAEQELIALAVEQPQAGSAPAQGGSGASAGEGAGLRRPSPPDAAAAQALGRSGSGQSSDFGQQQAEQQAEQGQQKVDDHSEPSTPAPGSQPYAANPALRTGGPKQGNGQAEGGGGGSKEGSGHGGNNRRAEGRGAGGAQAAPLRLALGKAAAPDMKGCRPLLDRVPSDQALGGVEAADAVPCPSEENSRESSADNSLLDDPLLKFLKQAMARQPSVLSPTDPVALGNPLNGHLGLGAVHGNNGHGKGSGRSGGSGSGGGGSGILQRLSTPVKQQGSGEVRKTGGSGRLSSTGSGLSSAGSLVVDIRPWQVDFADLQLQKKTIGEGSFGKVYVAKFHETLVAVKILLDLEDATASADVALTLSNPILHNLQKECALMAGLRHPNVVQFMGVSAMPPAMITEYCARGSLHDVLRICTTSKSKASQMTWLRRLNIALDATKGMLYLHRKGIIHRDLKSPNLLVESTWRVKVGDFNLSKIVEETSSGRSTIANMNPRWLAPEILNGEAASTASDVFSWGVVMWELLTFQCPWPHTSPWALVGKLMDGHRLAVPPRAELPGADTPRFSGLDAYVALMQRCWAQAPADRPDFEEVIHELRKMLEEQARSVGANPS